MGNKCRLLKWFIVILSIPIILFVPSFGMAGGGQHYPNGVEAFLIGIAPPPGFYIKDYNYFYTADKLKDNHGHTLKLPTGDGVLDRLTVYGTIPRFIWISKFQILGGFWGMHLFVPMLHVDFKLDKMIGVKEDHTGLGDLIFSPFIWSYHSKDGLLHIVSALDIYLPTGQYHRDHNVNIGKNFWTFEPVFAITGFLPQHKNLSASIKLMYDFNTNNNDYMTAPDQYKRLTPGQEFHFDYGIEYALTKDFRVGVGGYFYQQVTDDKIDGHRVSHEKGRVFAVGPGVWYNYQRWVFDLHGSYEMAVRNRPQGWTGLLSITYAF